MMLIKTAIQRNFAKPYITVFYLILVFSLSSCASSPNKEQPANFSAQASVAATSSCQSPLDYADRALHWTDKARSNELDRISTSLETLDGYCAILEFALFLSTPSIKYQDDNKALLLLHKLYKDTRLGKFEHSLVSILLAHVQQRQNIRLLVDIQRQEIDRLNRQQNM